ncbi:hypothetical protein K7X08_035779 [Anisodus acutangulus]|uniref:Uncharacterized protein n=1 Tax=Anisodus acutangulus TaxID=402998 RepID=A0A9Q1MCV3_9SOLA|nr:hypothetical protein K7X08_035779 [Anisodus acutangulus]
MKEREEEHAWISLTFFFTLQQYTNVFLEAWEGPSKHINYSRIDHKTRKDYPRSNSHQMKLNKTFDMQVFSYESLGSQRNSNRHPYMQTQNWNINQESIAC